MAVGDCQAAFQAAALSDGILLEQCRLPWINQRGHFGLPTIDSTAREALATIFNALGGDDDQQLAKRQTPLPGDFFHVGSRTIIEVDESQHFTSMRLTSLRLYPSDTPVGFDIGEYVALCEQHAGRADKYRAKKEAAGFPGPGGRQRQRAYYDALRDLAAPAMGYAPVVGIPVFDDDGDRAYRLNRDRVRAALGVAS